MTLKPEAGEGHVFSEWGGACQGNEECTITLTAPVEVTAGFALLPKETLTVMVVGTGAVFSEPEGIECKAGTCEGQFPQGSEVVLKQTPGEGQVFSKWTGACTGSEGCKVTMNTPLVITAAFTPPPPPVP